jgi:MFS family permease
MPVLLLVGVGLCIATVSLWGQTHRMLAIPAHYRSRMTSVNMMVFQISGVLGPALAGWGLASLSVHAVYGWFGLGLFGVGFGCFLVPGYRASLSLPHDQASGHYGRIHPELFR